MRISHKKVAIEYIGAHVLPFRPFSPSKHFEEQVLRGLEARSSLYVVRCLLKLFLACIIPSVE